MFSSMWSLEQLLINENRTWILIRKTPIYWIYIRMWKIWILKIYLIIVITQLCKKSIFSNSNSNSNNSFGNHKNHRILIFLLSVKLEIKNSLKNHTIWPVIKRWINLKIKSGKLLKQIIYQREVLRKKEIYPNKN